MYDLVFDSKRCFNCPTHDCLTRCQHLSVDLETAKTEIRNIIQGEDSFILHDCLTCYACEEYCPRGNHPFYLIVRQQEALGITPFPQPLTKRGIQVGIPFRGEPEITEINGPVLNLGVFSPMSKMVEGALFEGLTPVSTDPRKMFHYFCQLMYLHYARTSVINERLPQAIANIQAHKPEYVVHFHDECHGTYTSYAPAFGIDVPFKSVHLFEFLYQRLEQLSDRIKPLEITAAYQRPCSNRLCPETHPYVRKICDLIGITLPDREYMDENALCCAGTIVGQKQDGSRQRAMEMQQKNIEDMKSVGAQVCIFNCPACMSTMGKMVAEQQIMPLFLSDLCRLAIGEKTN